MKQYSEKEIDANDNGLFERFFPEDVNSYSFKCKFGDPNTIKGSHEARIFLLKDARLLVVEDSIDFMGKELSAQKYSFDLKNVEMTLESNSNDKSIVLSESIYMRNIKHFKRTVQLFGAVLRKNGLVKSDAFSPLELSLLKESRDSAKEKTSIETKAAFLKRGVNSASKGLFSGMSMFESEE